MDKKSGVYYYLSDNSLRVGGSSSFAGIVPMYTVKGDVGKLIKVNARDYREKLGFDLSYNQNYVGLDRILSSVANVEVLRCNLSPTVAYKIWEEDGDPLVYVPDAYGSADAVEGASLLNTVWVAMTSPGSWGDNHFVCFSVEGTIGNIDAVYTLHNYTVVKGVSSLIGNYKFSLSEASDIYYKNISFGDIVFGFKGDFPSDPSFFVDVARDGLPNDPIYRLHPGSNGSKVSSALDVSGLFAAIDKSPANIVVMNGFIEAPENRDQGVAVIQAIYNYCGQQDRSVLLDAPVLTESGILRASEGLYEWSKNLLSREFGQFVQVAARPDQMVIDDVTILIQPSVFLFQIYARMFANYGHINFVPAGNTYGSVSVSNLMDSDFHLYGDELKTNRINYLTDTSQGVCMWEYRTLYNQGGSDLSYSNTPYILRDLKGRLMSFMENFTFRYSTPIDLLTIRSGLDSILSYFVRNFFLVNYVLNVPSFEEAQAAGRELDIEIAVAVINSADVITLKVNLQNAASLRAS